MPSPSKSCVPVISPKIQNNFFVKTGKSRKKCGLGWCLPRLLWWKELLFLGPCLDHSTGAAVQWVLSLGSFHQLFSSKAPLAALNCAASSSLQHISE